MGIGRHVLGQDALSDTVANGVAGRIPAVIGGQAVHHLILIEAVDQGVVGTVGKGHVDDADGDAEVDGLFDLRQEIPRRLEHDREVLEVGRFRRRRRQRRIDSQQQVRPFVVDHSAADGFDVGRNGLANGLAVVAGHSLFTAAQGIDDGNLGMIIIEIVAGPGDEQQAQLVGTGEGAESRLGDAVTGHFQVLRFQRRLGADGIVIVAQAVIGKDTFAGIVDEAVIDAHVLAAPVIPVLQVFHWYAAHDGEPVVPFLRIQAFFVHLGLERRQLIDVGPHGQVIVRFDAFAAGPGTAHDRTEDINGYLLVRFMQGFDLFQARRQRFHGQIMLARIDKAAIDQGIDGQDHGVGLAGIGIDPGHELIRRTVEIHARQILGRRRQDLIARRFGRTDRIFIIDRPVILGYI